MQLQKTKWPVKGLIQVWWELKLVFGHKALKGWARVTPPHPTPPRPSPSSQADHPLAGLRRSCHHSPHLWTRVGPSGSVEAVGLVARMGCSSLCGAEECDYYLIASQLLKLPTPPGAPLLDARLPPPPIGISVNWMSQWAQGAEPGLRWPGRVLRLRVSIGAETYGFEPQQRCSFWTCNEIRSRPAKFLLCSSR